MFKVIWNNEQGIVVNRSFDSQDKACEFMNKIQKVNGLSGQVIDMVTKAVILQFAVVAHQPDSKPVKPVVEEDVEMIEEIPVIDGEPEPAAEVKTESKEETMKIVWLDNDEKKEFVGKDWVVKSLFHTMMEEGVPCYILHNRKVIKKANC